MWGPVLESSDHIPSSVPSMCSQVRGGQVEGTSGSAAGGGVEDKEKRAGVAGAHLHPHQSPCPGPVSLEASGSPGFEVGME